MPAIGQGGQYKNRRKQPQGRRNDSPEMNVCWVKSLPVCCLFRFSPPDRASRRSRRFATLKIPFPLAYNHQCILPSTSFCHRSLPSSVTGWPPGSLNSALATSSVSCSPLGIPPPSRLTALIRPSSSRISLNNGRNPVWALARSLDNLVGRSLILRRAPSPSLLSFQTTF